MSRPKRKPNLDEQLRAIIAQALEEGKRDLAKQLIDLLDAKSNEPAEKKEG